MKRNVFAGWLALCAMLLNGWLLPVRAQDKGGATRRTDVTIDRLPAKDKRFALMTAKSV